MINYTQIYGKRIKVPLLAKPEANYTIVFGSKAMRLDPITEAKLVYYVYGVFDDPLSLLAEELQWMSGYNSLTEEDIEEFIKVFKADHPTTPFKYKLKETPAFTEGNERLKLGKGYFRSKIELTPEEERLAINILSGGYFYRGITGTNSVFESEFGVGFKGLAEAFKKHCDRYGIKTSRKSDQKYRGMILATEFLNIHGLDESCLALNLELLIEKNFHIVYTSLGFIAALLIGIPVSNLFEDSDYAFKVTVIIVLFLGYLGFSAFRNPPYFDNDEQ